MFVGKATRESQIKLSPVKLTIYLVRLLSKEIGPQQYIKWGSYVR